MSKKALTIWFDDKGNMLTQAGSWTINQATRYNYKSEEAKDFDDDMEYVSIHEYRNSARVEFKSVNSGRRYSMFASDFNKVVLARQFNNNRVEGTFRFIKKGSGQAVKLVLPEKP